MKKLVNGIYRKIVLAIMESRLYYWLLMNVIPFIRFTVYYTSLRGWKYQAGYKLLQPGDYICVIDRKKLTSFLIPGEISHAGLCLAKGVPWEISEMTHHNYTKSTFFDMCKEADRVVICRCPAWDSKYINDVIIPNAKSFEDASYDVGFELGVKTLYCSELVYQADSERRLQVSLEDLAGIGRPYISPTGLLKAKNIEIVWDSDKEQNPFLKNL